MTKEKLINYVLIVAVCWLLYKIISFVKYFRLRKKLRDADLETFTNHLGEDYAFRFSTDEIRRYRWKKGLFVVKASFDKQDKLTYNKIGRFDFFTLFNNLVFN